MHLSAYQPHAAQCQWCTISGPCPGIGLLTSCCAVLMVHHQLPLPWHRLTNLMLRSANGAPSVAPALVSAYQPHAAQCQWCTISCPCPSIGLPASCCAVPMVHHQLPLRWHRLTSLMLRRANGAPSVEPALAAAYQPHAAQCRWCTISCPCFGIGLPASCCPVPMVHHQLPLSWHRLTSLMLRSANGAPSVAPALASAYQPHAAQCQWCTISCPCPGRSAEVRPALPCLAS